MRQEDRRSHSALCATLDSILQQQSRSERDASVEHRAREGEFSFIPYGTARFLKGLAMARRAFAAHYGRPAKSFLEIGCGYAYFTQLTVELGEVGIAAPDLDRKSTRLNSSH